MKKSPPRGWLYERIGVDFCYYSRLAVTVRGDKCTDQKGQGTASAACTGEGEHGNQGSLKKLLVFPVHLHCSMYRDCESDLNWCQIMGKSDQFMGSFFGKSGPT